MPLVWTLNSVVEDATSRHRMSTLLHDLRCRNVAGRQEDAALGPPSRCLGTACLRRQVRTSPRRRLGAALGASQTPKRRLSSSADRSGREAPSDRPRLAAVIARLGTRLRFLARQSDQGPCRSADTGVPANEPELEWLPRPPARGRGRPRPTWLRARALRPRQQPCHVDRGRPLLRVGAPSHTTSAMWHSQPA
jgi:hypothetical protein